MLTPTNVFLMGFIAHKPINPYQLVSRFQFHGMDITLKLANSSIYANIRSLHRQGFIDYEMEKTGKMPAKKMYTPTPKGLKILDISLKSYLSDYFPEWAGFTVSILFMSRFSKEALIEMLEKRQKVLHGISMQKENEYHSVLNNEERAACMPAVVGALHLDMHIKEELKITETIIDMLQKADKWPQDMLQLFDKRYEEYKRRTGRS